MVYLEKFSTKTRVLFERLHLAETPKGFFTVLKQLLQVLEKDPHSARGFKQLVEQMKQEDAHLQMQKEQVIEWMKQKLEVMRKLKCSKKREVREALETLDLFLSGKNWEVRTGGYLHALTDYFHGACHAVARYGANKSVEDFIKIFEKKHPYVFESACFMEFPVGVLDPLSKRGKILSVHLGHDFISAEVLERWDFEWDQHRTRIDVVCGEVREIVFHEAYYIWNKDHDLKSSKVALDSCGEKNLRLLLLLSQRSDFTPIPLCSLQRPNSFFEGESVCNQQLLQYYLSCFRDSSWEGAPFSKEAIFTKLQRLVTFLQTNQDKVTTKRGNNSKLMICRKIYREELEHNWNALIKAKTPPRTYDDFAPTIKQLTQAIRSRSEIEMRLEDISETLKQKELTKFGKEKRFVAKRGKSQKR